MGELIDRIDGAGEQEQAAVTLDMLCERRRSAEGVEGMTCFFSKTKPSWAV